MIFHRFAKKKLDDYSFFGGNLHVCYAPEYETTQETRHKLNDRRRVIAAKILQHGVSFSKRNSFFAWKNFTVVLQHEHEVCVDITRQ